MVVNVETCPRDWSLFIYHDSGMFITSFRQSNETTSCSRLSHEPAHNGIVDCSLLQCSCMQSADGKLSRFFKVQGTPIPAWQNNHEAVHEQPPRVAPETCITQRTFVWLEWDTTHYSTIMCCFRRVADKRLEYQKTMTDLHWEALLREPLLCWLSRKQPLSLSVDTIFNLSQINIQILDAKQIQSEEPSNSYFSKFTL